MPGFFNVLGKVMRHGQLLCIYPSAFESEEERDTNYSFPSDVPFEEVTIVSSDKVTLKCYLLRASQRQTRNPGTPGSSRSDSRSFRSPSPSIIPRATVIMFHGNGYHAWHHAYSGQQFLRLGCDVLLVSYRGYGHSTGIPSEKGLRRDAQAAIEFVLAHSELSKSRIILHGHSLGGAVAIDLAGRNADKISALIIENTFLSIPLVVKEIPALRHFTFVIHQKWESQRRILRIPKNVPILMLSGEKDEVVPEWHMRKLWELAETRGRVPEAEQNTTDNGIGMTGRKGKKRESEGESLEPVDLSKDVFKRFPQGVHADTWTRSGYWSTVNTFLEKSGI